MLRWVQLFRCFFFSSRRRHTRCGRDWSSDVCSSDLLHRSAEITMEKRELLYSGKAKSVYSTDNPDFMVLEFRDDTSAFDGKHIEQLDRKGMVNNKFNAFIMTKLEEAGIPTHFEKVLSDNEYHARSFGWVSEENLEEMKELTFKVNDVLKELFLQGGMLLVDSKLEFGLYKGEVVLGDEFSPDGCRLWDVETREKLDKDRFRQGLGGVIEAYEEVGRRIGIEF